MADHHHHHHRPNRITLPSQPPSFASTTPRPSYPSFYPPTTPTPTPSKNRRPILSKPTTRTSISFLIFLLLSLRSLYSLLPFLRASPPTFSIFPFAFLVSLLSFLLTLGFSIFTSFNSTTRDSFSYQKSQRPVFSLTLITKSQHKLLVSKSLLLAAVFLFRFQALMYCGTAAMILAEVSGNVAARFVAEGKNRIFGNGNGSSKVRGFVALFVGLFLLSISWDRIECFPLSRVNVGDKVFSVIPSVSCLRIWPMLLPFLSGFLGCYERVLSNWGDIRELGPKRVRLITLFFTTVALFVPAVVSMFVFEFEGDSILLSNLGWPLANTVVFGVLLSENYTDERISGSKDFRREYFVTFLCTLVLELFYYPELSLWGLLVCGLLMWISVTELDPNYNYPDLGNEQSGSFSSAVMIPVRHILSERKSRKIALFLLINTAYMVVEFVAGFMSNSLGLISDACHMLFDCAALAIGLYASYISRLPENSQFNFGRGRFEVLSGYVNAVFLVLVGALITLESFERILDPQEISTSSLLSVSVGGLLVNVVGLIFFHEEHHHAHGGSCSHTHTNSKAHSHSDHHLHNHDGSCSHSHTHSEALSHPDNHLDNNDGSCSHSHTHSEAHSHSNHHIHDHGHKHEGECITVVHNEKMGLNHDECGNGHENHKCNHHHDTDGQQKQHAGHDHHDHHSHHSHTTSHDHKSGESEHLLVKTEKKSHNHKHIDHNMQGIFLHVLADTLGSVGVVISTLLIQYKGWLAADPACSIFISVLIVSSVIPLLRNSAEILLQRTPRSCEHDLREALNDVMKIKGVFGIQNLHVWSFTNTDVVGTIHLHVSADSDKMLIKEQASEILHDSGVKDLTVQVVCVNPS